MDVPFTQLWPALFQVDFLYYYYQYYYYHSYLYGSLHYSLYLVAPFWAAVDISGGEGDISYQVYSTGSPLLDTVNTIISNEENINFIGHWMVVAEWDRVPEFNSSVHKVRAITKQMCVLKKLRNTC